MLMLILYIILDCITRQFVLFEGADWVTKFVSPSPVSDWNVKQEHCICGNSTQWPRFHQSHTICDNKGWRTRNKQPGKKILFPS